MKTPVRQIKHLTPQKRYLAEGEMFNGIYNSRDSHWGFGQTAFNVNIDGSFYISDNKPRKFYGKNRVPEGWVTDDKTGLSWPTHRSLESGWPGIWDFIHDKLWIYPSTTIDFEKLLPAFRNMIGHYGITKETIIQKNASDHIYGKIGDFI